MLLAKAITAFSPMLIAALGLPSLTHAAMSECAKDIAIKITGIYENGDTKVHYDYCENLHDGRGFTSGIAGFCTGTGDAWDVLQEYKRLTGSYGDFSSMSDTLRKYASNESSSTRGLGNYCKVWKSLGRSDKNFQRAQDNIRDHLYYGPAEQASSGLGARLDVTQGQLFDTAIQHGTGGDADGLKALIKDTNKSFRSDQAGNSGSTLNVNGHKVDEIVWLKKFIEVRTDDLKHPKEEENQGGNYWASTTYRTKSYSYIVEQGEYAWKNSVKVLDNDGRPTTVSCSK